LMNLLAIFPVEKDGKLKYPKEKEELLAFKGELTENEAFMRALYSVPLVRERIFVLYLQKTFPSQLREAQQYLPTLSKAMQELKHEKVIRFLEIVLAVANYMNNPNKLAKGFELETLSKLSTIKTADQNKTILHILGHMVYERDAGLLDFLDNLNHLEPAYQVVGGFDETFKTLQKSIVQTTLMIDTMKEASIDTKNAGLFVETNTKPVEALEKQYSDIKNQMKYFGYASAEINTIGFFEIWVKFIESFSIALNYNLMCMEKEEQQKTQQLKWQEEKERNELKEKFLSTVKGEQGKEKELKGKEKEKEVKDKSNKPSKLNTEQVSSEISAGLTEQSTGSKIRVKDAVRVLRNDRNTYHTLRKSRQNLRILH